MSILVVADEFPWPPVNGSRVRLAAQLSALRSIGPVDLFCVSDPPTPDDRVVPEEAGMHRVEIVDRAPIRRGPSAVVRWLRSDRPRELQWRDWQEARRRLGPWAAARYDLVWYSDIAAYLGLHDLVQGPVVVDYDDLESWKLRHRRTLGAGRRDVGRGGAARAVLATLVDGLDERRWHRVEQAVAPEVERVVVCSPIDRDRLGVANAAIVANGYPAAPGGTAPTPDPAAPTLLFIGLLTYPPNIDAAVLLTDEVLPRVQRVVPDATLRLVGRTGREVEALADRDGVTVVGPVPHVDPELRAARVVVVPIRFGGGTRVKILEAFAHRRPVVTTSIGGEGIDLVHGEHVLVADGIDEFADACVRLLQDEGLASRLVGSATRLFEERYRTDRVQEQVVALAAEVLDGATRTP